MYRMSCVDVRRLLQVQERAVVASGERACGNCARGGGASVFHSLGLNRDVVVVFHTRICLTRSQSIICIPATRDRESRSGTRWIDG